MKMRFLTAAAAFSAVAWAGYAQEILREGDASYASYTPWSKARTFDADGKIVRRGDQSRIMQNRPIYLVDKKSFPLPTNDWWTDALVSRWTGNLWSYPAKVVIGASGVRVAFPTYWIDNGTEVKERSAVVVGAKGAFNPDATLVESWHDWDVEMVLRDGAKSMRTTLVHGSPFTWIEYSGVKVAVTPENGPCEVVEKSAGGYVLKIGDDHYGVWEDGRSYVVIGLLPSRADFSRLAPYATAIIRSTRVDWKYDEKTAELTTTWNVKTEDLTGKAKNPIALQGFQPHHLRRTRPQFKTMDGISWLTPRGEQRINSLRLSRAAAMLGRAARGGLRGLSVPRRSLSPSARRLRGARQFRRRHVLGREGAFPDGRRDDGRARDRRRGDVREGARKTPRPVRGLAHVDSGRGQVLLLLHPPLGRTRR